MLKGKTISYIGIFKYINNFKSLVETNRGIYCDEISNKLDLIVLSDSYYKKFIRRNFKPKSNLAFISDMASQNSNLRLTNESSFLEYLGINVDIKEENTSVRPFKGESIREPIDNYTVIDLETTGKYVTSCEIIEMSAVRIRNNEIADTFTTLIKPNNELTPIISNITGITNEMLKNAPKIEDKIQEYINFIGNDVIVGHNIASFDSNIIYDVCKNLGLPPFRNNILDTYHYARYCDIKVPNYKLSTLTNHFGIKHSHAHRAFYDCIANYKCYELLKKVYTGFYNNSSDLIGEKKNRNTELNVAVDVSEKTICLSGDFALGSKSEITEKLEELGATVKKAVSGKTNYVIVGSLGSENWSYENYGTKIKKALEFQAQGKDIKIVKEKEFFYVGT